MQQIDIARAMSALLDLHLSRSIDRLKGPEMRGMSRLANATQTVLKQMDDEAGQIADELIAAQGESKVLMDGFRGVVTDLKANNQQVRDVLSQLTNGGPTVPNSADSAAHLPLVTPAS